MLSSTKLKYKTNKYYAINIVAVALFLMYLSSPNRFVFASSAESFYDYVREERRREVTGMSDQNRSETKNPNEILQKRQNYGMASTAILAITWYIFMCLTWEKFTRPYNVQIDDVTFDQIFSILPARSSAVIRMDSFNKYDIIAAVFDLNRRGFLRFSDIDEEAKIYINTEVFENRRRELESYEDFLIGWFITKIGEGGFFSFPKLWRFLSVNSSASEFDIDYDIWNDELSEYAKPKQIIDESTEKWKSFLCVVGAVYSLLGLLLLYMTDSTAPILLFAITFLSYRMPLNIIRRSKKAEAEYKELMIFSKLLDEAVQNENDFENYEKWDKYFIYSIVFEKSELVLDKYDKYRRMYYSMEEEFDKAIIHACDITRSPIE